MTPGDAEKLQRITPHNAIYLVVNGSVATLKAANAEYSIQLRTLNALLFGLYTTRIHQKYRLKSTQKPTLNGAVI